MNGGRETRLFGVACVLALAMVLGAYSNSLDNAFHFDDTYVVEGNVFIRSLTNIPRFFRDASTYSSNPPNDTYRPLVSTTLALDYWLGGGLQPRQFRLTQLTLLVLLGVAVFLLGLAVMNRAGEHRWNRWAALVAATFYAVHTTATETLNLIHVRSELLAGLGVVGSFLVYLYWPRSRRAHLYLLPMAVGALAKTPAVMFAPLFCLYLVLFEQPVPVPRLFSREGWPHLVAALRKSVPALVVGAGLFLFVESMNAPTLEMGGGSRLEYLRSQPFMWLHYGRLFLVPLGLSADTDWVPFARWYDTRVFVGVVFVAFLMRILWVASKTPAWRPVAFGIGWFMLALLPASSLFPLAEVTNDHRPFFAYVGLSLALVWGLAMAAEYGSHVAPRRQLLIWSGTAALVLLGLGGNAVGTFQRNTVFRTDESFWADVVEKSPGNGRGLMNYGLAQMSRGRFDEAKAYFDRAAVYLSNYARLEINLGIVTDRLGQPAAAEAHFMRGIRLGPNDFNTHLFYARWLLRQGRTEDAIELLQRSVALSPAALDGRHELLGAYAAAGRTADVTALAAETLALAPGDPFATEFLADPNRTAPLLPAATGTETAEGFLNASLRLYQAGDVEGSIAAARRALELRPDYPEAHNNIAAGFGSLGRWDEAIAAAREALRLRPDFARARNNLAWAEGEKAKVTAP